MKISNESMNTNVKMCEVFFHTSENCYTPPRIGSQARVEMNNPHIETLKISYSISHDSLHTCTCANNSLTYYLT